MGAICGLSSIVANVKIGKSITVGDYVKDLAIPANNGAVTGPSFVTTHIQRKQRRRSEPCLMLALATPSKLAPNQLFQQIYRQLSQQRTFAALLNGRGKNRSSQPSIN